MAALHLCLLKLLFCLKTEHSRSAGKYRKLQRYVIDIEEGKRSEKIIQGSRRNGGDGERPIWREEMEGVGDGEKGRWREAEMERGGDGERRRWI